METAREVLDWLDEWMAARASEGSGEALKLWSVMSALRGPDDPKSDLKDRTTVYIRREAFPRLAEVASRRVTDVDLPTGLPADGGRYCYISFSPSPSPEIPTEITGDHFKDHVYVAARALGLLKTPRATEGTGSSSGSSGTV